MFYINTNEYKLTLDFDFFGKMSNENVNIIYEL